MDCTGPGSAHASGDNGGKKRMHGFGQGIENYKSGSKIAQHSALCSMSLTPWEPIGYGTVCNTVSIMGEVFGFHWILVATGGRVIR